MEVRLGRKPMVCIAIASFIGILPIIFWVLGYRFIVRHETLWFSIQIAGCIAFASLCLATRKSAPRAAYSAAQALPLVGLVYGCITVLNVDGVCSMTLGVLLSVWFLSCYIVSLMYASKRLFFIVCIAINSSLLLIMLAASGIMMTVGQFGENAVVSRTSSPGYSYTAILINSDHGALGGNTFVDIEYHPSEVDIGLGRLVKVKPIYRGSWGDFNDMHLEWADDNVLMINGKAYGVE